MGDQVFIYKLDKTSGWSVTTREASIKQITGSGITVGWSGNKVTLTNDVTVSDSLTDTSATKALSAAKGKELSDQITALNYSTCLTSSDALDTISDGMYYYIANNIPTDAPINLNATVESITIGNGAQKFQTITYAESGVIKILKRRYFQSWGGWYLFTGTLIS